MPCEPFPRRHKWRSGIRVQVPNVGFGVIRVGLAGPRRLPVYSGERTFSG